MPKHYIEEAVFELGKGTFSSVHCHRRVGDDPNKFVAVKKYVRKVAYDRADRILQEKSVMLRLSSEAYCDDKLSHYIVKFIDTAKDEMAIYLIMEPILGGPLHKHLLQSTISSFHISVVKGYIAEIASALLFMAKYGVIHRDIKASNILVHSDGHLKICDFGSSKILYDKADYSTIIEMGHVSAPRTYTYIGSTPYMAPEIVACKQVKDRSGDAIGYNFMADWWSLGVLAFEMSHGIIVSDTDYITDRIASDSFLDSLLSHTSYERIVDVDNSSDEVHCLDFIHTCLFYEADDRVGPFEPSSVRHHPFFSSINWDDVDNGLSRGNPNFDRRIGYLDFVAASESDASISQDEENLFDGF